MLSILGLGFLLGVRHAADPDHLVAVSTFVAGEKRRAAWLLGAFWGIGHTATICLVGALIIVFKIAIPARVGLSMEFAVGLVLLALGVLNIISPREEVEHSHVHTHEDAAHGEHVHTGGGHAHSHSHVHEASFGWLETRAHAPLWRVTAVGLVHGLAGSAAIALLVLASVRNRTTAFLYLPVFGAGTLFGMTFISGALEASLRRFTGAQDQIRMATGLLSAAFGAYVVYRIGFVDGLFLQTANWTPQ